ncbi:hypothetical protein NG99_21620 [Erwinia typographi]|uniref:Ricin B lectin domain-containing protein n=2 Tax=Erwinia typographi TaxID=371042 RepID=A0A0A3YSN3_9GAMM|nr:hypothetical protein NG99_21620 [Erwinia typographi]
MGQGNAYPDPNSPNTAHTWKDFNRRVVRGINTLHMTVKARFGVINGDITEFGRPTQRASFNEIYNGVMFPLLIGLGNHDYESNINDCAIPFALNFSMNACAYSAAHDLENRISQYRKNFENFSADITQSENSVTQGSMGYSWDSNSFGVSNHFVQLHLAPGYKVWINNMISSHNYDILDSLSWLRHDLDKARKRGVNNIFLNFHAMEWLNRMPDSQQQQLKSIIDEYKISAIFVGHSHYPLLQTHRPFGKVPIYTSGALYSGYVDVLNVDKEGFQVKTYMTKTGKPEEVIIRDKVATPKPPSRCYKHGTKISAGNFVRTEPFNKNFQYVYLRQNNTSNALDANMAEDVYTNKFSSSNPYMRWKLKSYWTNAEGETYYTLTHLKSGKVLDSNSAGKVYTKKWNGGRYQQWKLLKYSDGSQIQLINVATGRILDANSNKNIYTKKSSLKFTNGYQNWQIVNPGGAKADSVKYFEAKSANSWSQALPQGTSSNQHWSYAGERSLTQAAPCI